MAGQHRWAGTGANAAVLTAHSLESGLPVARLPGAPSMPKPRWSDRVRQPNGVHRGGGKFLRNTAVKSPRQAIFTDYLEGTGSQCATVSATVCAELQKPLFQHWGPACRSAKTPLFAG